ncbi:MAG: hypothetical protein C0407_12020 [Desulfobacca sp.]|nr:hypothetical protein [Desulfobacca sp.]
MILNALTITVIFFDLLSLGVNLWGGLKAFHLYRNLQEAATPADRGHIEDQSYLLFSLVLVALIIRLINWPLFYLTLHSFIPQINGAMCIFGVTQVREPLTRFLELIKPLEFFLIGGWLILHHLDRATLTNSLLGRKLVFLVFLSAIILVEVLGDLILFFTLSPNILVSCCTTVTDILNRSTAALPQSILGPEYKNRLEALYWFLQFILIGLCGYLAWSIQGRPLQKGKRILLTLIGFLSLVNAATFLLVQIESFAPRFMGLPYHHCLYCLWQLVPDSILLYLFFILGTMGPGWAWMVDRLGREGEAEGITPRYLKALLLFSAVSLTASLSLTLFHFLK